jgi:hypothetical protein
MKPELSEYELTELEIRVLNILLIGHRNAIGLKELCKRLVQKDDRKVRIAIEQLRNQGYLVLFAQREIVYIPDHTGKLIKTVLPSGYFIAETMQETAEFIEYMRSRVIAECKIMRSIKIAAFKKYSLQFGQLPLFMK